MVSQSGPQASQVAKKPLLSACAHSALPPPPLPPVELPPEPPLAEQPLPPLDEPALPPLLDEPPPGLPPALVLLPPLLVSAPPAASPPGDVEVDVPAALGSPAAPAAAVALPCEESLLHATTSAKETIDVQAPRASHRLKVPGRRCARETRIRPSYRTPRVLSSANIPSTRRHLSELAGAGSSFQLSRPLFG